MTKKKKKFETATIIKKTMEKATQDHLLARRYHLISHDADDSVTNVPDLPKLSTYREVAVGYIAGFVARMVVWPAVLCTCIIIYECPDHFALYPPPPPNSIALVTHWAVLMELLLLAGARVQRMFRDFDMQRGG